MSALQQRQASLQPFDGKLQPRAGVASRAAAAGTLPSRQLSAKLACRAGKVCCGGARVRPIAPRAAAQAQTPPSATATADEEFDWRLGVGLGVCAFEAYTEDPSEDNKKKASEKLGIDRKAGVPLVTPNGTKTYLLDPKYLMTRLKGRLEVKVQRASGLLRGDVLSKSDAYCKLELDGVQFGGLALPDLRLKGSMASTRVVHNQKDPVWDETLQLLVEDPKQDVTVSVLDNDPAKDDLLGLASFKLDGLLDGKPHALTVELKSAKGKAAGKVQLEARFRPFSDPDEAQKVAGKFYVDKKNPWRYLVAEAEKAKVKAVTPLPNFELLAFVDSPSTDTQVLLFWSRKDKSVSIAFRGTEVSEKKDVVSDIRLVPSGLKAVEGGNQLAQEPSANAWIHKGFRKAYGGVRGEVMSIVDALLGGKAEGEGPWTIYVTGHSLGAALSTLCAGDLALRTKQKVVLYNYGSPRVGNTAFAEDINRLVPNFWRVVNKEDIVTQIPPPIGYCHIGNACTLTEVVTDGKKVVIEAKITRNTSKNFDEGLAFHQLAAEVVEGLMEKLLGGKAQAASIDISKGRTDRKELSDEEMEEMLKKQKRFVEKALDKNNSSISQHMGDQYAASVLAVFKLPELPKDPKA